MGRGERVIAYIIWLTSFAHFVTNLVNYSSDVAYTLDGTTGIKAWISYSNSIKKIRIGF